MCCRVASDTGRDMFGCDVSVGDVVVYGMLSTRGEVLVGVASEVTGCMVTLSIVSGGPEGSGSGMSVLVGNAVVVTGLPVPGVGGGFWSSDHDVDSMEWRRDCRGVVLQDGDLVVCPGESVNTSGHSVMYLPATRVGVWHVDCVEWLWCSEHYSGDGSWREDELLVVGGFPWL